MSLCKVEGHNYFVMSLCLLQRDITFFFIPLLVLFKSIGGFAAHRISSCIYCSSDQFCFVAATGVLQIRLGIADDPYVQTPDKQATLSDCVGKTIEIGSSLP